MRSGRRHGSRRGNVASSATGIGDLYTAALDFRDRALRREAQAARLLSDAYGQVFRDVLPYFEALSRQVAADIAGERVFTVDRMRRLDRYVALLDQVRRRTAGFAEVAAGQVEASQRRAVRQASAESQRLMGLATQRALLDVPDVVGRGAVPEGMSIESFSRVFNRLPVESLEFLVGSLGDGTPLRRYFLDGGVTADAPPLAEDVIDQVQRSLAEALAAGWNPRRSARLFREAMGIGLTRALRISRTESLRAYREASRANYAANGFAQWEWLAALDDRTCLACVGLDGMVFEISQPMQAHVNCRCTMVPVLPFRVPRKRRIGWPDDGGMFEGTGEDWFAGLTPLEKRSLMGPGKYDLWAQGGLTLADFRHEDRRRAQTFGSQFVEATLGQVRGRRGGGGGGGQGPGPVQPTGPVLPAAMDTSNPVIAAVVRTEEGRIRVLDHEEAVVVGADGGIVLRKGGGKDFVSFTRDEMALMKDRVLTHNHPAGWTTPRPDPRFVGNAFSSADVRLAMDANMAEIRAVTPVYVYSLKRGAETWGGTVWDDVVRGEYEKRFGEVQLEFILAINSGTMTVEEAEARHWHEVWSRVFGTLNMDYSREEWGG